MSYPGSSKASNAQWRNCEMFVTCLLCGADWICIYEKRKKCTLVQALRLCTGRTAHRGSRGIALIFLDHGTRRGEGSASRPGRSLPPGKSRYPLYWAVALGLGVVLQIGRSLFRSQLVSLEIFIEIKSFRSHYGPGVDSASNRNEYQEYFLGVKAAGA